MSDFCPHGYEYFGSHAPGDGCKAPGYCGCGRKFGSPLNAHSVRAEFDRPIAGMTVLELRWAQICCHCLRKHFDRTHELCGTLGEPYR